ncbi:CHAT domain-containing protein [Nostoc sp. FACHB-110]|uniref:CHAT domain-containing protein n=1 Tax=Nostoc sp. FACHB-110 TaxID=2692834 RepID=UPI0016877002|nr:CHAT domain-containing protein [Nostoc sp. FACHB-110]MBD2440968.1 CHAT domain-containing protein [Nostoc sp. FACHB-110]
MYKTKTFILAILFWLLPTIAKAQITAAPDGTGTVINTVGNNININGGSLSRDQANLFHSFSEFNVNKNQTANFLSQPSIQNILGRVTGGNASLIDGLIRITGGNSNLYLMNPAGIVFGSNASLNVPASFTATTATKIIFDNGFGFDSYSANNYAELVGNPANFVFDVSQPGSIINAGSIAVPQGQNLFLLGGNVVNTGTLTASEGKITIVAVPGSSLVRISQPGHILSLEIDPKAITDSGINPLSLPDLLTGAGHNLATRITVDNSGAVRLTNSQVILPQKDTVAIASGVIDVSGKTGGQVNVLGSKVGLINGNVNASGANIGGKVLIGGDYQGQGTVPYALQTFIDNKSTINADSLFNGDGGRVIVWADKITRFDGSISARGGKNSGDGGFVEVSGKDKLIFSGNVDLTASKGNLGTLLLDPFDINIVDSSGTNDSEVINDNQILVNDSPNATFTINNITLASLGANIQLQAANNINVQDGISLNFVSGGSIIFTADSDKNGIGSFLMDKTQSITAPGRDIFISGSDIITGNISTHVVDGRGGNVSLLAQNSILTGAIDTWVNHGNGGNVDLSTGSNIVTGGINDNGLGGFGSSDAPGGIISFNAANSISTGNIFNKNNTIAFNGAFVLNNDVSINSFGGDVRFASSINGANNLTINADTGNIIFNGAIGNTSPLASLNVNSTGTTQINSDVTTTSSQNYASQLEILNNPSLTGNEINFANNVSGSGNLKLQPFDSNQKIALGGLEDTGTDTLNLLQADLNNLQNGFSSITIGRENSSGQINLANNLTFSNPIIIQSPLLSGYINTNGFDITSNKLITLLANQNVTAGNINTLAGNINIISRNGEIKTKNLISNGGNISLNSNNLTIGDINTHVIDGRGGNVSLSAQNSISTGAIDTWVNRGSGGNIDLNIGSNGVINTGNLTSLTSEAGFGGDVNINANGGNVRTGSINSYANRSSDQGGDIIISGSNIVTGGINDNGLGGFGSSDAPGGIIFFNATNSISTGNIFNKNNTITFNGAFALNNDVSINSFGGNVEFASSINGANNLTINAGEGNITFKNILGTPTVNVGNIQANSTRSVDFQKPVYATSLTTDGGGTTQLNGDVTTTGNQTYNDAVTLANNPHLSANEITFNSTVNGDTDLSLNVSNITFNQAVGSITSLKDLTVNSAGVTQFRDVHAASLNTDVGGTTKLNGNVTTTGNQTYNDAVILANSPHLSGKEITFDNTVDGDGNTDLNLNASNITFNQAVGGNTPLNNLSIDSEDVSKLARFNALNLDDDTATGTQINADIITNGNQTYNDAVTIANNSKIIGHDITFNRGVNSNQDLTINATNITFANQTTVGQAFNVKHSGLFTLSKDAVINLASDNFTPIGGAYFLGGTINTVGKDITFNQPVTLIGSVQLNSAGGNIHANATIQGNHALNVDAGEGNITFTGTLGTPTTKVGDISANSTGTTQFQQNVYATSLTTDTGGTTQLNGDVTTTGNQTYNDAVILANNPHLSANEITFNSTVDGVGNTDLSLNASNIIFNQAVGGNTPLNNLSIDSEDVSKLARFNALNLNDDTATGTQINADIITNGNQTYNDAVTLANNSKITGQDITFNRGVNTEKDLTINTTNITFANQTTVGQAFNVKHSGLFTLSKDAVINLASDNFTPIGGAYFLGGTINTVGKDITFNQPVTLIGSVQLNSAGGNIHTNATIQGNHALSVDAGHGDITFTGTLGTPTTKVGDISANSTGTTQFQQNVYATSLTTDAGGTTQLNGDVTTTGNQTYNDAVTLANNPLLLGSKITFNNTVDGYTNLNLNADNIIFAQSVGNTTPLKDVIANSAGLTQFAQVSADSLNTDAGGITQLNGNIYTTGNQTYGDNVIIANNPNLISNQIIFKSTVNGFSNLIINSNQELIFNDAIGNITNLNNLTVNTSGSTDFLQKVNVGSLNTNVAFKTTFLGDILTQSGAVNLIGNDDIITQNIITRGGDITIKNQNGLISTKKIDSSNFLGNGGDVFIQNRPDNNALSFKPNQDITVTYINAQGGFKGSGGDVRIITDGFFRANETFIDSNLINASISTNAGILPGSIIIDHGGNGVIPFFVGRNTINGTVGSITAYFSNTLFPTQFFPDRYSSGNIQITTQGRYVPLKGERNSFATVYQLPSGSVLGLDPSSYIENFELNTVKKYSQLLGSNLNVNTVNTIEKARQAFKQSQQKTGVKSALIYVSFTPTTYFDNNTNKSSELKNQYQLELLMVTSQKTPIRLTIPGATKAKVIEAVRILRTKVSDRDQIGSLSYLKPAQQLYDWLISPLESDLKSQGINNLMFVMDDGLRLIPIAALHDGQQFLIEKYSLALLPSFSLTDTTYAGLKDKQILAMGAERFPPDQEETTLEAVPIELSTITQKFRKGKYFLNQDFNLENLKSQSVNRKYQIIHLATHADFPTDERGGHNQSYIQLYDRKIHFNQIRQLGWNKQPPVELLVLSACRTAVGDEEAELGFAGLAYQTGVKSALASLWYVSDVGTLGLMTEFYEHLNTSPIKADALRQSQIAMLSGQLRLQDGQLKTSFGELTLPSNLGMNNRVLKHPYYWAAFTLIGSPW